MPGYRTHLIAGFISAALLLAALILYIPQHTPPLHYLPGCFFAALLGSLFPDIDISSKMQNLFYCCALIACATALFFQAWATFCTVGIAAFFVSFLYHRTITHNYKFLIVMPLSIPLYICYQYPRHADLSLLLYLFFVIGTLSHVVLDRSITRIKQLLGKKRR